MTTFIEEVSPTLSSEWIQDAAKQTIGTDVPSSDVQATVTPDVAPVTEELVIPPATDVSDIEWGKTVGELLDEQVRKESFEQIKSSEDEILKDIWVELEQRKQEVPKPVAEPEPTKHDKGDEPSPSFEKQLQEIKAFTEEKLSKITEDKYRAEVMLEQTQKQHEIEKKILEEKIAKLSEENVKNKQETLPKDDDTLVAYNYLRQGFKSNPDDPAWGQKLWKFHVNFAANLYWVPQWELDNFIVNYHNRQKMQKDALAWWYSRTWGWVSNDNHYQQNKPTQLPNRDLL